ncbi:MAG: mannitol dehydrogenase, partial [Clostridia bacterium]|nr:mannitol dehydrogenase [Clostridia bacterium]
PFMAKGIELKAMRGGYLNFVTCENWKKPADILRNGISAIISDEAKEYFENNVGITESVVMRSAIESDAELLKKDPLIVNVQNFWELPLDADRLKGSLPNIKGIKPMTEFSGFLERKFYTYNAANGTTSYMGALLGYDKIADAAHDERILKILDGVYKETSKALSVKHGIDFDDQWAFTRTSLAKLQDYTIVDFIERNARDPIRKLGPDDRLVGSARLVEECGIVPENLCVAIAAAIEYTSPGDEFAEELARMRKEEGIDYIIENVCKLNPSSPLAMLIKEKRELLKKEGYINE